MSGESYLPAIAAVLATVLTAIHAVGHDGSGADHCGGSGHGRADDTPSSGSCRS